MILFNFNPRGSKKKNYNFSIIFFVTQNINTGNQIEFCASESEQITIKYFLQRKKEM